MLPKLSKETNGWKFQHSVPEHRSPAHSSSCGGRLRWVSRRSEAVSPLTRRRGGAGPPGASRLARAGKDVAVVGLDERVGVWIRAVERLTGHCATGFRDLVPGASGSICLARACCEMCRRSKETPGGERW